MNDVQQSLKRAFIGLIILVAVLAFFFNFFGNTQPPVSGNISISQVIADAQKGKIAQIEIQRDDPHDILITYKDRPRQLFFSRIAADESIMSLLLAADVPLDTIDIHVAPLSAWGSPMQTMMILLPPFLMLGLFIFLRRVRQAQQQQIARQSDQQ